MIARQEQDQEQPLNNESDIRLITAWRAARFRLQDSYRRTEQSKYFPWHLLFHHNISHGNYDSDDEKVISNSCGWLHDILQSDQLDLQRLLRAASQAEAGLTLLHVFIYDLLGRSTGRLASRLFRQVVEREFRVQNKLQESIKEWQRYLAIAILFGVNVFSGYYTLLRGLQHGLRWQKTFLIILLGQWLSDMLFVRVLVLAVIDCFLPYLITAEVKWVWNILDSLWQRRLLDQPQHSHSRRRRNLARYLFVSQRCAELGTFSQLLESQLILSFYSGYLPVSLVDSKLLLGCNLYHNDDNNNDDKKEKKATTSFVNTLSLLFLSTMLTVSHTTQSAAIGALASLLLTLFASIGSVPSQTLTQPWVLSILCIVPVLILAAIWHWIQRKNRLSAIPVTAPTNNSGENSLDEQHTITYDQLPTSSVILAAITSLERDSYYSFSSSCKSSSAAANNKSSHSDDSGGSRLLHMMFSLSSSSNLSVSQNSKDYEISDNSSRSRMSTLSFEKRPSTSSSWASSLFDGKNDESDQTSHEKLHFDQRNELIPSDSHSAVLSSNESSWAPSLFDVDSDQGSRHHKQQIPITAEIENAAVQNSSSFASREEESLSSDSSASSLARSSCISLPLHLPLSPFPDFHEEDEGESIYSITPDSSNDGEEQ